MWEQFKAKQNRVDEIQVSANAAHMPMPASPRAAEAIRRRLSFRAGANGNLQKSQSWDPRITASIQNTAQPLEQTKSVLDALHKDKRVRKRSTTFAYTRFYLMSIWYLLMAMFYYIFILPTNSDRYYSSNWLSNVVIDQTQLANIQNTGQMWDMLQSTFISERALLQTTHLASASRNVTIGVYLLGAIRLRQVRGKLSKENCVIDDSVSRNISLAKFRIKDEITTGDWNVPDHSVFGEAQVHYSHLGIHEGVAGDFGPYPDGGYKVDLDKYDEITNLKVLQNLRDNQWVDGNTRALFVYFNIYNQNLPISSACRILFEIAPTGEMSGQLLVVSDMIYSRITTFDNLTAYYFPSTALTAVIIALLLFLLISELSDAVETGFSKYLRDIGNLYDLAIMICVFTNLYWETKAVNLVGEIFPMSTEDWNDSRKFFTLLEPLYTTELLIRALGVAAIFIWIRVLQYTVYLPTFGPIVRALVNTLKDLSVIAFTTLLIFCWVGFTLAIRSAASDLPATREYRRTLVYLFRLFMGQWPDATWINFISNFGVFLCLVFVVLMNVLLMNIFISILTNVYPKEKQRAEEEYNESLNELIQLDYLRRHNPLLSPITASKPIKFLHTLLLRPLMQVAASVIGGVLSVLYFVFPHLVPHRMLRFHPAHVRGTDKEFGWERGLSGIGRVAKVNQKPSMPASRPSLM
eukprot:c20912_g1_i1.p1 GENE.c20912_g1_i1~~c20912_g1_i1.p1  ORF type:complete len:729 (-),score=134.78 c20912_g1_i1:24-2099(-)